MAAAYFAGDRARHLHPTAFGAVQVSARVIFPGARRAASPRGLCWADCEEGGNVLIELLPQFPFSPFC
jgi:hypothetical protein